MFNSTLKPISKKRYRELRKLDKVVSQIREQCNNLSELSGDRPDWQSNFMVEPHHITGRTGDKLTDPFNIIMLTRNEHTEEEKHKSYDRKQKLLKLVEIIRINQGYTH